MKKAAIFLLAFVGCAFGIKLFRDSISGGIPYVYSITSVNDGYFLAGSKEQHGGQALLLKTDFDGKLQWGKYYGDASDATKPYQFFDVEVSDDDIFVSGRADGNYIFFGRINGSDGSTLWGRKFPSGEGKFMVHHDGKFLIPGKQGVVVVFDSDGNLTLAVQVSNNVKNPAFYDGVDTEDGKFLLVGSVDNAAFILKVGEDLEVHKSFQFSLSDTFQRIIPYNDGFLLLGTSVPQDTSSATDALVAFVKASDLSVQWAKRYGSQGGSFCSEAFYDGVITESGDLLAVGLLTASCSSAGGFASLDPATGNLKWAKKFSFGGAIQTTTKAQDEAILLGGNYDFNGFFASVAEDGTTCFATTAATVPEAAIDITNVEVDKEISGSVPWQELESIDFDFMSDQTLTQPCTQDYVPVETTEDTETTETTQTTKATTEAETTETKQTTHQTTQAPTEQTSTHEEETATTKDETKTTEQVTKTSEANSTQTTEAETSNHVKSSTSEDETDATHSTEFGSSSILSISCTLMALLCLSTLWIEN